MSQLPEDDQVYLDHVGHFVPDLDAAATVLESAGFILTPHTRQCNLTDGGLVPSGTSNRCIMLREGYLEILAATDDTPLARQLDAALARYTGLHLVALAVADASRAHVRLTDGGFEPLAPVDLRRPVETADDAGEACFTVLRVAPGTMPEGRIQMLRHHTPGLVWQERWLAHGNGIDTLAGTLLCVADPDEAAARFSRFSGARVERRDARRMLALDRGALCFVDPDALAGMAPFAEAATSAVPRIVATALGSIDIGLTSERLGAAGIRATGSVGVPGGQTSYAFPSSVGAFATVVPVGAVPDWLA